MGSKEYASTAELDAVMAQLTEAERGQCYAELAPAVTLFFPDNMQSRIDAIDPAQGEASGLRDYAGNKRYEVESAGITVDGHAIATDVVAQGKIADCTAGFAAGNITDTVAFKCADGTFFDADQAAMDSINAGVSLHVQACYDAEKTAVTGIDAGTITTEAQVDACFAGIAGRRRRQ